MSDGSYLNPVMHRGAAFRAILGVGLWPAVVAEPLIAAFTSASWNATVNALAVLALLGTAYLCLGIPVPSTVPRWERWALLALALAVVLDSALRASRLAADLSPASAVMPAAAVLVAAAALYDRRVRLSQRTSSLSWPPRTAPWWWLKMVTPTTPTTRRARPATTSSSTPVPSVSS